MLGLAGPTASVSSPSQTARVSGPPDAPVSLLVVEGGLYTAGVPGGGFDVDPFEANTAIGVTETTGRIGANGTLDVPVTLSHSDANGGINHIVATLLDRDGTGRAGPLSSEWGIALGDVVGVPDLRHGPVALPPAIPNSVGPPTGLQFSNAARRPPPLRFLHFT